MSLADSSTAAWGRLWRQGLAHSFGGSDGPDGWRESPLADFWAERLPEGGPVRLLDLCTGNGVLLQSLLNLRSASDIVGVGVDLASVAPRWLETLSPSMRQRVNLLSEVNIEALPFPLGSFDCVVSQFGIEYADLSKALAEAYRVLTPGGHFVAAIHHPNSRPVTMAHEELAQIEWVLGSELLPSATAMCHAMALLGQGPEASRLHTETRWKLVRQRYDAVLAQLNARANTSPFPDFLRDVQIMIGSAFRSSVESGAQAGELSLSELERTAKDSMQRLQQMISSARTDEQLLAAMAQLSPGVTQINICPLWVQGHDFGHCLEFSKS
ncbi:MAG: methyltransferase domain-containing protein [Ideonella sp.]|nr:methyltransferase domain-containing protein [Ideonella sp.]